jgi:acyl carrier protein
MNESDILTKIQECLAGALGIEPEEVQPESSLVRDLGAESIDFIDIIFRIEKAFDIKIPSGELFPANLLNEERLVQAGRVTPEGLKTLRDKIPYLDLREFEKDPQVSKLAEHFKVQMILDYVREKLSKGAPRS